MTSPQTVSAIIPTYNRSKYLGEALDSVLAQTHPPQNVLVVDDGSTDDTSQVLKAFGNRISVLRKDNGGKSTALNLAMSQIDSNFVWFFDDDDIAMPAFLETHLSRIEEDSGFTCAPHIPLEEVSKGKFAEGQFAPLPDIYHGNVFHTLLWSVPFMMGSMLIRTKCLLRVGQFDDTLTRSQDYDYMLRLAAQFKATPVQDAAYKRRKHLGERGKSGERFSWSDASRSWYRYEKEVLKKIYAEVPLATYVPAGCVPSDDLNRAALITRFAVMYRCGNLDLARQDLISLNDMEPFDSLTPYEVNVLRRGGDSPKWPNVLHDVDMTALFRGMRGALQKDLSHKMSSGAYHKLRRDWPGLSLPQKLRQFNAIVKLRTNR